MKAWLLRQSATRIRAWFLFYFLFLAAWMVVPPLFHLINRADPWVLGVPFVLFMIGLDSVLVCVGLAILFEIERIRGEFE